MPRFAFWLLFAALTLPCAGARAGGVPRHYEGVAYAGSDNQVVYKEEHFVFTAPDGVHTRLVIYRCPNGEPFARKWVRDVPSDEAPDFDLTDQRFGYREGVRTVDGHREVFWRENAQTAFRTAELPARANPVVDAGFDAFVRNHWNELSAAGRVGMAFAVPSRLSYLAMRLKGVMSEILDGEPVLRVRLSVDTWYGFAAPTIDLSYANSDHLLRRFSGLSNILDSSGKRQEVRIEFPTSAVHPPADTAAIDQAAALSLVTRCSP